LFISTIILLSIYCCDLRAQGSKYRYQQTINLVALVNDAALRISHQGERVFREFMTNGTRWRSGDTYMFVCGLKGDIFVHEDPSLIGKNEYDLKDVHGKPIVQWFIRKALGTGQCGWTHYEWVRPGKTNPSWKTSYVKLAQAPSGTVYIVGSGLYDMRMEKEFAVEAVNDAINLIRIMGPAAFVTLRDSTSEFVYKDTYVFVLDSLCNTLVNPSMPWLVGRNVKEMKDTTGRYFFHEMIKLSRNNGQGWVEYMWPKPGSEVPVHKLSFVKGITVRGNLYMVGTGIYPD